MVLRFFLFSTFSLYSLISFGYDFNGWSHDASGYEAVVSSANATNDPYIVLYHVEWCPSCKKLTENFLSKYEVQNALASISKAEINPDKSEANKALLAKNSINQYPTFLIIDPQNREGGATVSLYTVANETPAQFAEKIKSRMGYVYSMRGKNFINIKKYDNAITAYEKSIEYEKSAFNYVQLAYTFHMKSMETKNISDIEKAKLNYKYALEKDPNHKEAKNNLKLLEQI